MKLWMSPYLLKYNNSFGESSTRPGFLLKMETENFKAGYADYFPWPEFGDANCDGCLQNLRSGKMGPLLKKSLYFAMKDGEARAEKRSLFENQNKITNHLLILDPEIVNQDWVSNQKQLGFQSCKIKVGNSFAKESKALSILADSSLRLRLDFNGKMNQEYLALVKEYANLIEYIEDPFAEPERWSELQGEVGVSLAYDQPPFTMDRVKVQTQIIKPAKQELLSIDSSSVVFTSYMDHPVGIAHALWEAQSFGPQRSDYGLMSYGVYEDTAFHKKIREEGCQFSFVDGYGVGFDDLWETLEWQPI